MKNLLLSLLVIIPLFNTVKAQCGFGFSGTFNLEKETVFYNGISFYFKENNYRFFSEILCSINLDNEYINDIKLTSQFGYSVLNKNKFSMSPYIGVGLSVYNRPPHVSFGLLFENGNITYGVGYNSLNNISIRLGFYLK